MPGIDEPRDVQWYYAKAGRQEGPVSEADLDHLVRNAAIPSTALVWREGMTSWQPYSEARTAAPAPNAAPPPPLDQNRCVECQRTYSTSDLLRYENVFVCAACKPGFFQKLREGVPVGSAAGIWRSGRQLVMRKDAVLPQRCLKCNAEAGVQKLTRKLYWHPPLWYLLILLNLVIYVIVALIIRKRAQIEIGVCETHRRRRVRNIVIAWLLVLLSAGVFAAGAIEGSGAALALAFLLFLAGAIYGTLCGRLVAPQRIDDYLVWLNGAGPEYLAQFPEWTGPR